MSDIPTTSSSLLYQWHAAPLSIPQAKLLKSRAESLLTVRPGKKVVRYGYLLIMQSRYWLHDFSQYDFLLLMSSAGKGRRVRALLFLAYGQLLIARKVSGAFTYLDQGLRLADGILSATTYFQVYNRHQCLRRLRLSDQGSKGCSLKALLTESAVIDKITQTADTEMTFQPSRFDTLINKSWN